VNFITVFLATFSLCALAGSSIELSYSPGLTGSAVDRDSQKLQADSVNENRLEYQFSGTKDGSGVYYGAGYSMQSREYHQYNGSGSDYESYNLIYNYLYGRVGYGFKHNSVLIKPSLRIGSGAYGFEGTGVDDSGSSLLYGLEVNVNYKPSDDGLYYKFGIGYGVNDFPSQNNGATELSSDDYSEIGNVNFGIGYSF
jgi:hypothetical protein